MYLKNFNFELILHKEKSKWFMFTFATSIFALKYSKKINNFCIFDGYLYYNKSLSQ